MILASVSTSERASLERVWDALNEYPEDPLYRQVWQKTVWESITSNLSEARIRSDKTVRAREFSLRRLAVAAVVLVVFGGMAMALLPVTHRAGAGEILSLDLPDGSHVEINSGSVVSHRRGFFTGRDVRLEGEAFFHVVKDNEPFLIETFNARVRVVGTQFNVRARTETAVSVLSGTVQVSPLSDDEFVSVDENESAVVNGATVYQIDTLDSDLAFAWRRGDLIFSDSQLSDVAAEIERRFATKIELSGAELGARRVTVALRQPASAESVVTDLCEALDLRYRRTSEGFELFAENTI